MGQLLISPDPSHTNLFSMKHLSPMHYKFTVIQKAVYGQAEVIHGSADLTIAVHFSSVVGLSYGSLPTIQL